MLFMFLGNAGRENLSHKRKNFVPNDAFYFRYYLKTFFNLILFLQMLTITSNKWIDDTGKIIR